jgi:hypothetical protein
MCTVASAPRAASVRVWHLMSRGRGHGGRPLPGALMLTILCRLLVKIVTRYPRGLAGALMRWGLPSGTS